MRNLLAVAVAAWLSVAAMAAPAEAATEYRCTGIVVGPRTFDNVVVPTGAQCVMSGVTIKGNLKALRDSRLAIRDSTIHGSVDGDKADSVQVINNTIRGNVQIHEGGPSISPDYEAAVCGNTFLEPLDLPAFDGYVRGNIHVHKMTIGNGIIVGSGVVGFVVGPNDTREDVTCLGNTVRTGNIQVEENVATPYAEARITIQDNDVRTGDLQVEENVLPDGGLDILFNFIGTDGNGGNLQLFKNSGDASKTALFNIVSNGVIQCFENSNFVGFLNVGDHDPSPDNQCIG